MISWDVLNKIIENRMHIPLDMAFSPINVNENEEIAMINQIVADALSIRPDWSTEKLPDVCDRVRKHLGSTYIDLSHKSAEEIEIIDSSTSISISGDEITILN